ncbi:MAG: hypothetical protein ACFFCQ_14305, partial [Promethearchaeota archaeon]
AISPRLLRDPLSIELVGMSSKEKEAHVVGYLTDILQLIYCIAKGLEGWQFSGISLLKESLKIQHISKINILLSLIHVIKREINDV